MKGHEPATISPAGTRTHIMTVALEEYFQGVALAKTIDSRQWPRFETRFEKSTLRILDLLERFGVKATFFVMGWTAERRPDLVREVARRGHEIASAGYTRQSFRYFDAAEFRKDLRRAQAAIEKGSEKQVLGFRVADRHLGAADLWALEVLAQEGYRYDSSFSPSGLSFRAQPWRRYLYAERLAGRQFWELPLAAINIGGLMLPIAGGNYFRQLPASVVRAAMDRWNARRSSPLVLYCRVWDFDPEQPRISSASLATTLRHYRNPEKVPSLLTEFLGKYRFTSAANYLGLISPCLVSPGLVSPGLVSPGLISPGLISPGLVSEKVAAPVSPYSVTASAAVAGDRVREGSKVRRPITIVVPCFNEEATLPFLANTLRDVQCDLDRYYRVFYVFVDDGSRDGTWETLQQLFAERPECCLVRLAENRGVMAAILAGIGAAQTEVVCSIDCDCTYDPRQLCEMIPLLSPAVDLVTASPYHPDGRVLRVPRWRLALSRGASLLYRLILNHTLHTYTSCFRVYRRSAVLAIEVRENGFLGVAELLAKMIVHGSRIVEYPATLDVRLLGRSKMKIIRSVSGHLRLLAGLAAIRAGSALHRRPGYTDARSLTQDAEPDQPLKGMRDEETRVSETAKARSH